MLAYENPDRLLCIRQNKHCLFVSRNGKKNEKKKNGKDYRQAREEEERDTKVVLRPGSRGAAPEIPRAARQEEGS